jgi:hypothetical protein
VPVRTSHAAGPGRWRPDIPQNPRERRVIGGGAARHGGCKTRRVARPRSHNDEVVLVTVRLKSHPPPKKPAPAAPPPPAAAPTPPAEPAAENQVYWGDAILFKLWLAGFGILVLLNAVIVLSNFIRLTWH